MKPKKMLKESEKLIKELVEELRDYLKEEAEKKRYINLRGKPAYSGVGSLPTRCTACQRRKFG